MINLKKCLCSIAVMCVSIVPLQSQESDLLKLETKVAEDWNRLQGYVSIVRNSVLGHNQLEASDEQIAELQILLKDQKAVVLLVHEAMSIKDPADRLGSLMAVQSKMDALATKLDEEILLPHQVAAVKKMEFDDYLFSHEGDYAKVMESVYGEKFGLTESQRQKLDDARKKKGKDIELARAEYLKKLNAIELEYRTELSKTLTADQKAKIEKHSGEPLVPKVKKQG